MAPACTLLQPGITHRSTKTALRGPRRLDIRRFTQNGSVVSFCCGMRAAAIMSKSRGLRASRKGDQRGAASSPSVCSGSAQPLSRLIPSPRRQCRERWRWPRERGASRGCSRARPSPAPARHSDLVNPCACSKVSAHSHHLGERPARRVWYHIRLQDGGRLGRRGRRLHGQEWHGHVFLGRKAEDGRRGVTH